MPDTPSVTVVRLGHRPGRDDRMTTHVGLTARAFGADRVILPTGASDAVTTVEDVTDRFGGPFTVDTRDTPVSAVRDWDGACVHLTMYGEPIQTVRADIRDRHRDTPLLVVVGAEKVPGEVYDAADWNVAITNQPHSEIAGLAVFLDHLYDGDELDQDWVDATRTVVPQATGKRVDDTDST